METDDYASWKNELATSLTTNHNNMFSKRQPALANRILNSPFPDTDILNYYVHPIVSSRERLLLCKPEWKEPDLNNLAGLCRTLFAWDSRRGMCKFMRSITPGYLIWKMLNSKKEASESTSLAPISLKSNTAKSSRPNLSRDNKLTHYFKSTKADIGRPQIASAEEVCGNWTATLMGIHSSRRHISTDNIEELRLSYIPSQILPYTTLGFDLSQSPVSTQLSKSLRPSKLSSAPSRSSKYPDSPEITCSDMDEVGITGEIRRYEWTPDEIQRIWVPRPYVVHAYPRKVKDWDRAQSTRKTPKRVEKQVVMIGSMDRYVRRQGSSQENTKCLPVQRNGEVRNSTSTKVVNPKGIAAQLNSAKPSKAEEITPFPESRPLYKQNLPIHVQNSMFSDSDSDSLPSPRNLLDLSQKSSKDKATESEKLRHYEGKVIGSFRESLGETLHEVEDYEGSPSSDKNFDKY